MTIHPAQMILPPGHSVLFEAVDWAAFETFIAHEPAIRGKRTIDLAIDPPPDLALEIDITTRRDHRSIYAALRVPELWRFDGARLHIHCLCGDAYIETERSDQFPDFPLAEVIPRLLEQSRVDGRNAALRAFRDWAPGRAPAGAG